MERCSENQQRIFERTYNPWKQQCTLQKPRKWYYGSTTYKTLSLGYARLNTMVVYNRIGKASIQHKASNRSMAKSANKTNTKKK